MVKPILFHVQETLAGSLTPRISELRDIATILKVKFIVKKGICMQTLRGEEYALLTLCGRALQIELRRWAGAGGCIRLRMISPLSSFWASKPLRCPPDKSLKSALNSSVAWHAWHCISRAPSTQPESYAKCPSGMPDWEMEEREANPEAAGMYWPCPSLPMASLNQILANWLDSLSEVVAFNSLP